jgi:hypothetical protein
LPSLLAEAQGPAMKQVVLLSCLLGACVHSPAPTQVPRTEADPDPPVERALIATVRTAPPATGYVDLGPVVLHRTSSREDIMAELQMLADLLHADGFVLESEGQTFAGSSANRGWSWSGSSGGGSAAILFAAIALAVAAADGTARVAVADQHYYFRAYRLAKAPPPPVELDASAPIPEILRLRIAAFKNLGEQIKFITELTERGEMELGVFEKLRQSLCQSPS